MLTTLVFLRYGTRTLELLKRYYQRELTDLSNDDAMDGAAEAAARSESQHEASTSGRDDGNAATNGGNTK